MVGNKVGGWRALRIAVGLTALMILFAGSSGAATLTVNASGGADYTRIQDAINNASAGDTILVQSGTYNETVTVNKQLNLSGIDTGGGMPIVNASSFVIWLSANGITLEGFKAETIGGYAGIFVVSNDNIIKNNTVSNYHTGEGIVVNYHSNNTLIGNIASGDGPYGIGIYLYYTNNNTLNGNTISNNSDGISMPGSSNNLIYNNIFNNSNNVAYSSSTSNIWNTSKTAGTNIIGGPYIGGNFWANPSGTGFSQTCLDNNNDGICDSPFTVIDSNNIDYLPLAPYIMPPKGSPNITSFDPPSPVSNLVGDTQTFNITVNQTVNVTWYINGTFVQFNESDADYTNTSAVAGFWNVTAIANNTNGSAMQIWDWIVTAPPAPSTWGVAVPATSPLGIFVLIVMLGTTGTLALRKKLRGF